MIKIKKASVAWLLALSMTAAVISPAAADEIIIEGGEAEAGAFDDPTQEGNGEDREENREDDASDGITSGDETSKDANLIDDGGSDSVVSEGLTLEQALESEAQAALEESRQYYLKLADLTIDAASRQSLIGYLNNLRMTAGPTGSDGELKTAAYIREVCEELGYTVEEQGFHEGFLNEEYIDVPGVNIIVERGADGMDRTKDILILTAHYDSKTDPREDDLTANDKSGAAVLLETARILAGVESNVDICFLFLSGEEDGWYGSRNFADHLSEEQKSRILGVISLDRVGYALQDDIVSDHIYLGLGEGETENSLTEVIVRSMEEWRAEREAADSDSTENSGVEVEQTDDQSEQIGADGAADGADSMDAAEEESEDGRQQREEWSTVPDAAGSAAAFARAGLKAVAIFQDLTGRYQYVDIEEAETERQPEEGEDKEDNTDNGKDLSEKTEADYVEIIGETEQEESARVYLAEADAEQLWDIERLQMVTDILARTAVEYIK